MIKGGVLSHELYFCNFFFLESFLFKAVVKIGILFNCNLFSATYLPIVVDGSLLPVRVRSHRSSLSYTETLILAKFILGTMTKK